MATVRRETFCRFMIFAVQKLAKLQKNEGFLACSFFQDRKCLFRGPKKQGKEGCKILLFLVWCFLCKSSELLYGLRGAQTFAVLFYVGQFSAPACYLFAVFLGKAVKAKGIAVVPCFLTDHKVITTVIPFVGGAFSAVTCPQKQTAHGQRFGKPQKGV